MISVCKDALIFTIKTVVLSISSLELIIDEINRITSSNSVNFVNFRNLVKDHD